MEEPGEARSFDGNGRLSPIILERALWGKGKCMNSWKKRKRAYINNVKKEMK